MHTRRTELRTTPPVNAGVAECAIQGPTAQLLVGLGAVSCNHSGFITRAIDNEGALDLVRGGYRRGWFFSAASYSLLFVLTLMVTSFFTRRSVLREMCSVAPGPTMMAPETYKGLKTGGINKCSNELPFS